jgi:hypothetical protein
MGAGISLGGILGLESGYCVVDAEFFSFFPFFYMGKVIELK